MQAVVVQHAKVGRTRVTESNNIKIKTLRKAEGSFEDKYLRIDLRKFHLLMRQKIEIHVLIIAGLSRLCRSRVFVLLAIYIPMKSIVPKPLWFVPIAALALLGAGCFSPAPEAPPTVAPTPVKPAPSAPTPSEPTPSEPAPSTPSGYELPEIDATWQTYTNNALGFSFPVPGSIRTGMGDEYRFESDAKMKDGCYFDEQTDAGTEKRVAIDGRNSVHECDGSRRRQPILHVSVCDQVWFFIRASIFTKRAVNGDNYDEPACRGKIVFLSAVASSSCRPTLKRISIKS